MSNRKEQRGFGSKNRLTTQEIRSNHEEAATQLIALRRKILRGIEIGDQELQQVLQIAVIQDEVDIGETFAEATGANDETRGRIQGLFKLSSDAMITRASIALPYLHPSQALTDLERRRAVAINLAYELKGKRPAYDPRYMLDLRTSAIIPNSSEIRDELIVSNLGAIETASLVLKLGESQGFLITDILFFFENISDEDIVRLLRKDKTLWSSKRLELIWAGLLDSNKNYRIGNLVRVAINPDLKTEKIMTNVALGTYEDVMREKGKQGVRWAVEELRKDIYQIIEGLRQIWHATAHLRASRRS